ncbi:MAG: DNA polymerase III subunit gamma/tau [Campylobacterales bacterium]|nr:DNA polymerase III subunit gamma/tau [Campylobacterales bacterium]
MLQSPLNSPKGQRVNPTSEVLARKYRPANFEELIGQESISQTLSLALDANRLSHAYLFSGLRGSGKTSTARIFAKALICDLGPTSKPCGTCPNCTMAAQGRHMDIVEMDAASSRKIDDIRDLIEHTKYKPASAAFKIFIIDEVHMLTKEAFNALLKTLEEPPSYVKFILATTDPLKLPATILSRTQHFRFKRIATHAIVAHLSHILHVENIGFEPEALEILARSGSGSLRDTLTLLDQAIIYSKNYVDVATVTEMLGLVDPQFLAELFDAVLSKDKPRLIEYLRKLDEYEAEMVVDEMIAYLQERLYAHDATFSTLLLERFFRILSDAKGLLGINAEGGFVLGLVLFKMVEALKVKEIDQMIESLEQEIRRDAPATITAPNLATPPPQPMPPQMPPKPRALDLFETLRAKIMDRNSELGSCFAQQIHFVSFEEGVLTWESCADEQCKKMLKEGYSVIRNLVQQIFGFETKIVASACTQTPTPSEPTPQESAPQSASMTEEIETYGGSCVASCDDEGRAKEYDGGSILEEPLVKKAAELFEARKITVQSKV